MQWFLVVSNSRPPLFALNQQALTNPAVVVLGVFMVRYFPGFL